MSYTFYIVDVFTRDRLAGNPLAVVMESDKLADALMLAIAGEFGFSETVFLHAPQDAKHLASMKIFTPKMELPFAGHPTIGAAVVLGLKKRVSAIRLEQQIGVVTAVMEKINDRTGNAVFNLPKLPERLGPARPAEELAAALGLEAGEIGFEGFEPGVWSAGVPFTLVPIAHAQVLSKIRIQRRGWRDVFEAGAGFVFVFAPGSAAAGYHFIARMFAPAAGLDEDPGTGSAVAAMAGLVAKSGAYGDGGHALVVRQGVEMGRPSTIELQVRIDGGKLVHAAIGGDAVILAEGRLDPPV